MNYLEIAVLIEVQLLYVVSLKINKQVQIE